jgi:hypothetical protein
MIVYVLVALAGLAIALVGSTTDLNWLLPVGLAIIIGGFFWFVRHRQGTPVKTKDDGLQR